MPKDSPPSRRGRSDEELLVRKYSRKYTIFDRLGVSPQLLAVAFFFSFLVACALLVFTMWQNSERLKALDEARGDERTQLAEKDKTISQLKMQVGTLKAKADLSDAKDQQITEQKTQIDNLTKQVACYQSGKCKPGNSGQATTQHGKK